MKPHRLESHVLAVENWHDFCRCRKIKYPQKPHPMPVSHVSPLIFPITEKTQVIYLNGKARGGIQFVSQCAALCRADSFVGRLVEEEEGSPGKPVTSAE